MQTAAANGKQTSAAAIGSLVLCGAFAALVAFRVLLAFGIVYTPPRHNPLPAAFLCIAGSLLAACALTWILRPVVAPGSGIRGLILRAAIAWVWIPPVLLLLLRGSSVAVWLAAAIAAVLALSMRGILPAAAHAEPVHPDTELFAAALHSEPRSFLGLALAVCLYAALFAFNVRFLALASILLAGISFSLAWQLVSAATRLQSKKSRPALRLLASAVFAILSMAVILLPGIRPSAGTQAGLHGSPERPRSAAARRTQASGIGSAYGGIILWPIPLKKQIVPPLLSKTTSPDRRLARPLVIPFNGPYWYYEARAHGLGANPHIAHGDPIAVNIRTNDWLPLVMEARQNLATPIGLSACRAIRVAIRNGDHRPGGIALGLLLTDSGAQGQPSIYLGAQPILSSRTPLPVLAASADESLTFDIPPSGKLRHFDAITVLFFPDTERSTLGSRIAVQEFELSPR